MNKEEIALSVEKDIDRLTIEYDRSDITDLRKVYIRGQLDTLDDLLEMLNAT